MFFGSESRSLMDPSENDNHNNYASSETMVRLKFSGAEPKKRTADRNRQMKVHENEPVTSTAVSLSLITCWNAELPNRKSDLTVTICLISAGVMSSCKRWIQTVHGMKLTLCTSFFTFSNSSFQSLTFPYFLAFLFSPLDSWQGLEVKRCCGQLWNVESASGADLEPIRAQERRGQERERERIVKVWMGFSERVKGGEDGEKETVRGGALREGL